MFFFRPQPSQAPVLRQRFLASPVVSPRLRCGAARRLPVTCRSLPVQPAVTSTAHNSTADTEGCRIFAPLRSCASRTASPKWVRRRNHRDLRGPSAAPSVPSEVLHARIVCLISAGRSPRGAATRSCGVVRRTSRVTGPVSATAPPQPPLPPGLPGGKERHRRYARIIRVIARLSLTIMAPVEDGSIRTGARSGARRACARSRRVERWSPAPRAPPPARG